MRMKFRWGKSVILAVAGVFVLSTVAFAVNNGGNMVTSLISDNKAADNSAKQNVEEVKKDNVTVTDSENKLSQEKLIALYNQGYGVQDIEKAQELAVKYNMAIEDILARKGKSDYAIKKVKQPDGKENTYVEDKSRPWIDVIAEIDMRKSLKESGESEDNIAKMEKEFRNIKIHGKKLEGKELENINKKLDEGLKNKYKITNSEIEQCKKYGIDRISEIAFAKDMANKHNVKLEKVLEVKKNKKFWDVVGMELGGGNSEK